MGFEGYVLRGVRLLVYKGGCTRVIEDHHRTSITVRVRVMAVASFKLLTTLLLLALAIAIAAKPVAERKIMPAVRLPLTKRRSLVKYNIMESDLRRLNSLRKRAGNQDDSNLDSTTGTIPATFGVGHYTVSIGVGEPSTSCKWFLALGNRWRN